MASFPKSICSSGNNRMARMCAFPGIPEASGKCLLSRLLCAVMEGEGDALHQIITPAAAPLGPIIIGTTFFA
jgi:hypothetical protein